MDYTLLIEMLILYLIHIVHLLMLLILLLIIVIVWEGGVSLLLVYGGSIPSV